MDFGFSEREEMLRKSVREFAEAEVTPKMEAMEETGEFPTDLLKPMADLGIMGVITPPDYDGVGLGYVARTIVLEELGRICAAMPMALQVHHMGCAVIISTSLSKRGDHGLRRGHGSQRRIGCGWHENHSRVERGQIHTQWT